eukprot:TRINITY_DN10879_c0_g1_i2.p1 TRINITY_DN10879_c0_g1~~TRINITY_DN10879_c0_g1_i2.p1  ORF type:complete len:4229 (-),score=803.04 TRINITY_DN10879_c0_g1_i2:134-12820(-)
MRRRRRLLAEATFLLAATHAADAGDARILRRPADGEQGPDRRLSSTVCEAPLVTPYHNASDCEGLGRCDGCTVTCKDGHHGQPTDYRCIGEGDPLRLQASLFGGTCDSSSASGQVRLFAETRCGLAPCCPAKPEEPAGCHDFYGEEQCTVLMEQGYTCEVDFCPSCGVLAGYCDKSCHYGACSVCGDCWIDGRLSVDGAERCDDGNNVSGDGCSSDCFVESDYMCTSGTPGHPSVCETCMDLPGWVDSQGYSCEHYVRFGACDVNSQSTNPAAAGGRIMKTPQYHAYTFAYDLAVTTAAPLILKFRVRARDNAHLYIGHAGVFGFEVIIGGWNNDRSVLRKHPGAREIGSVYGPRLHVNEYRDFWLIYAANGSLSLGHGHVLHERTFLGNDQYPIKEHLAENWGNPSGPTALDRLYVATGWGSGGEWEVDVESGGEGPTIGDLASGGKDATQACCACGGEFRGRRCELEDDPGLALNLGRLAAHPTPAPPPASARRLSAAAFVGQPTVLGRPTVDGFPLRALFANCEAAATNDCKLDAIVVPLEAMAMATAGVDPLAQVWPQQRSPTCRLRDLAVENELRWEAHGCLLADGGRYVLVLSLKAAGGVDVLSTTSVDVPSSPRVAPARVTIEDRDPGEGLANGVALITKADEEADILQYRLFWARNQTHKIEDSEVDVVAIVNTFAGGGFRNERTNECMYNDCTWKLQKAQSHRRRGWNIIVNEDTEECLCFHFKTVTKVKCPTEVLTLDHPDASDEYPDENVVKKPQDCLWMHKERRFNTSMESRLINMRYQMCLCQVDAPPGPLAPDGRKLPPPRGASARDLLAGRWCELDTFTYHGYKLGKTAGYCEWTSRPLNPIPGAAQALDTASNATLEAAWRFQRSGVEAWKLSASQELVLPDIVVGGDHTFAAWVMVDEFVPLNHDDASGHLQLFGNATESCLMLKQRTRFLDPQPACGCGNCSLVTSYDELGSDKWTMGLTGCGSTWDSGFDLPAPSAAAGGSTSGWVLVASAGSGNEDGSGETAFFASMPIGAEENVYTGTFGCSTPGCTAIGYVRDVPRDPYRTCFLSVHVYVTDFGNPDFEYFPEVVEFINISAGHPRRGRQIFKECNPKAANDPTRLYTCVYRHGVDDLLKGSNASRQLEVSLKITDHVNEYPTAEGMLLAGVAKVHCKRVTLPDKRSPTSGGLRQVGVASRTCAGTVLQAVGGSAGQAASGGAAPTLHVGEAYYWDRRLSDDELVSLFHGTRMRYNPIYEAPVADAHVRQARDETLSSAELWCEVPGCTATRTITGIPSSADAKCLLTVSVALTDFGDLGEVVEFVKLDGIEVLSNCWPGRDNDQEERFFCTDELDVSQSLLKSTYLHDGEVEVEIKISDEVNAYPMKYGARYVYLYALVLLRCSEGRMLSTWDANDDRYQDWAAGDLLFTSLKVTPQTSHIIVQPSSDQGEGPGLAQPFVDRVNAFTVFPEVIQKYMAGAKFTFEVTDPDGAMWVYAIVKDHRNRVDVAGVLDALPSLDICPFSHRRRGPARLSSWNPDPRLTNCDFQATVPYLIVVYVDREATPHGGGSLVFVDVEVDSPPGELIPQLLPQYIEFEDTNTQVAKLDGTVILGAAYNEMDITHYEVHWGRQEWPLTIISDSVPVITIAATGEANYSVPMPGGTVIPKNADCLLIYSKNSHGLSKRWKVLGLRDLSMALTSPPIISNSITTKGGQFLRVTINTPLGAYERLSVAGDVQLHYTGKTKLEAVVVKKGDEAPVAPSNDYRVMNLGALKGDDIVCRPEQDLLCEVAPCMSAIMEIGPCENMLPGEEYAVVIYASINFPCPCRDLCVCTGEISKQVQVASDSDLTSVDGGNYVIPADHIPPDIISMTCGDDCPSDDSFTITVHASDVGKHYPVMASCMACRGEPQHNDWQARTSGRNLCIRASDSKKHRYWRIRAAGSAGCRAAGGGSGIAFAEVEFYELSPLNADGLLIRSGLPIGGWDSEIPIEDLANAFDGNGSTGAVLEALGEAWIGLDLGAASSETALGPTAVLRARVRWHDGTCMPPDDDSSFHLEWSDDGQSWHRRASADVPAVLSPLLGWLGDDCGNPCYNWRVDYPDGTTNFINHEEPLEQIWWQYVAVDLRKADWNAGSPFQTAFTNEGVRQITIAGLTPKTHYNIGCYLVDTKGNEQWFWPLSATTRDYSGPHVKVHSIEVRDFSVHPKVSLMDPGNSYPALTSCVARDIGSGPSALPSTKPRRCALGGPDHDRPQCQNATTKLGRDQLCHVVHARSAAEAGGRIPYEPVFETSQSGEVKQTVTQYNSWGGVREELRSCGLRRAAGHKPGSCFAHGGRLQAAEVTIAVRAYESVFVFIGEYGRAGMGYEFEFGGWNNTKATIRRGFSADFVNVELPFSATMVTDLASLHPDHFVEFWISADPSTGWIRIGRGIDFKSGMIAEWPDPEPLKNLDVVYVGAGIRSGGATAVVCPRLGNVARGKHTEASSVAFGGTPDKAVDGLWGENEFCTYCPPRDTKHVCAGTRRGSKEDPPWIRVDLGQDYRVKHVRLVVPPRGRPEQVQGWSIWLKQMAHDSYRSSWCANIDNAEGDNYWPCQGENGVRGQFVTVYGDGEVMAQLPESFGLRVCEFEVYILREFMFETVPTFRRFTQPMHSAQPEEFTPGLEPSEVEVRGLQPNHTYEVFCYGEDAYGNSAMSNVEIVTTLDNTAPTVHMLGVKAGDHDVAVNVSIEDPGMSYPVRARCAATLNGATPQEHEPYFERRFWRARFRSPPESLDAKCYDQVHARSVQLLGYAGHPMSFDTYVINGEQNLYADLDFDGVSDKDDEATFLLEPGESHVMVDTEYVPPVEQMIRKHGGSLHGDIVVSFECRPSSEYERRVLNDLQLKIWFPDEGDARTFLTDTGVQYITTTVTTSTTSTTTSYTTATSATTSTTSAPSTTTAATTTATTTTTSTTSTTTTTTAFNRTTTTTTTTSTTTTTTSTTSVTTTSTSTSTTNNTNTSSTSTTSTTTTSAFAAGGEVQVSCKDEDCPVLLEHAYFALANPGTYRIEWGLKPFPTSGIPWTKEDTVNLTNESCTMLLKVCGRPTREFPLTAMNFTNDEEILHFDVPQTGCSRDPTGLERLAWQSTLPMTPQTPPPGTNIEPTKPPQPPGHIVADGDYTTCFETGGYGRDPADEDGAWWRLDLGATMRVDALWIVGNLVPGCWDTVDHDNCRGGTPAERADVWVVAPDDTNYTHGQLCAENVPIVNTDRIWSLKAISCYPDAVGAHLWVVAQPSGMPLSICEIEVFTSPIRVVSEIRVQFGWPPQPVIDILPGEEDPPPPAVCGASHVHIEWSHDNVTWQEVWDMPLDPHSDKLQSGAWAPWGRLFLLPFHTDFEDAGMKQIELPNLRENTSYDVFCWATDRLGNSLSRELSMLALPWADTRLHAPTETGVAGAYGTRRLSAVELAALEGDGLRCTSRVRELIPCEDRVTTSDRDPPKVHSGTLVHTQKDEASFVPDDIAGIWRVSAEDPSCMPRQNEGVRCIVRCIVTKTIYLAKSTSEALWEPFVQCDRSSCMEARWTNEAPVEFWVAPLRPETDYAVLCEAADPWGNVRRYRGDFKTPESPEEAPVFATPLRRRRRRSVTYQPEAWTPVRRRRRSPSGEAGGGTYEHAEQITGPGRRPDVHYPSEEPEQPEGEHRRRRIVIGPKEVHTAPPTPAPLSPSSDSTASTSAPPVAGKQPKIEPLKDLALSLGVASEEEAQMMQRPAAATALIVAVRGTLQLSPEDQVDIDAVTIEAPAAVRRLQAGGELTWGVLAKMWLRLSGTEAHKWGAVDRLQLLTRSGGAGDLMRSRLGEKLRLELASRQVLASPEVIAVAVEEEEQEEAREAGKAEVHRAPSGGLQKLGQEMTMQVDVVPGVQVPLWMLPTAVVLVLALFLAVVVGAFRAARRKAQAGGSRKKSAVAGTPKGGECSSVASVSAAARRTGVKIAPADDAPDEHSSCEAPKALVDQAPLSPPSLAVAYGGSSRPKLKARQEQDDENARSEQRCATPASSNSTISGNPSLFSAEASSGTGWAARPDSGSGASSASKSVYDAPAATGRDGKQATASSSSSARTRDNAPGDGRPAAAAAAHVQGMPGAPRATSDSHAASGSSVSRLASIKSAGSIGGPPGGNQSLDGGASRLRQQAAARQVRSPAAPATPVEPRRVVAVSPAAASPAGGRGGGGHSQQESSRTTSRISRHASRSSSRECFQGSSPPDIGRR